MEFIKGILVVLGLGEDLFGSAPRSVEPPKSGLKSMADKCVAVVLQRRESGVALR